MIWGLEKVELFKLGPLKDVVCINKCLTTPEKHTFSFGSQS